MLAFKNDCDDDFFLVKSLKKSLNQRNLKHTHALRRRVLSFKQIEKIVFHEGAWEIHVTCKPHAERCPTCNGPTVVLYWYQSRYLDAPIDSKIVRLFVMRPSYFCTVCDKSHTPPVQDVVKGYRITQRLLDYVLGNICYADSLRSLANSVGASPKTISELLQHIADQSKEAPLNPTEIGIHQLNFNEQRYLVLSNLANRTIVDLSPLVDHKAALLSQRLIEFNNIEAIQVIVVPADIHLINVVENSCRPLRIEISIDSIYSLVADKVAMQLASESRRGRPGSISSADARRLAVIRRCSLSDQEVILLEKNLAGKLFDAKEELLACWEESDYREWINVFRSWYRDLPPKWWPVFHEVMLLLAGAEKMGVEINRNRTYETIDISIIDLQWFLQKSGRSFTTDMFDALVRAAPSIPNIHTASDRIMSKRNFFLWREDLIRIIQGN